MKKLRKIINNIIAGLFWLAILGWIVFASMVSHPEDPPKKPKEDTTKVDIKQMKEKNDAIERYLKRLDSLTTKIDTLKKK